MNLEQIAYNIEKKIDGIYYSKTSSAISYPEEGNKISMQLEEDSFWFNHRNDVIVEGVKKYSREKVLFDIGGGNGFVSRRLQNEGIKVVLIEPGPTGAIHAKKRGIKHIICATLQNAQFKKCSMESAGMFDVIEHIENDRGFLYDLHSCLHDEAHIYITVPAYAFLWSKEDDIAGHFRRYTLSQLEKLLIDCGYEVLYATYMFSVLPLPIFLFRSIPGMMGLRKSAADVTRYKKEHSNKQSVVHKLLQKVLVWELKKIKEGRKISFGASCFVIAKKRP